MKLNHRNGSAINDTRACLGYSQRLYDDAVDLIEVMHQLGSPANEP